MITQVKNVFLLLLGSALLVGCQPKTSVSEQPVSSESQSQARVGDTTLEGKLTLTNGVFSVVDGQGKQTEVDSYNVDLAGFEGKRVRISGQYSGDTLFAAKVEDVQ